MTSISISLTALRDRATEATASRRVGNDLKFDWACTHERFVLVLDRLRAALGGKLSVPASANGRIELLFVGMVHREDFPLLQIRKYSSYQPEYNRWVLNRVNEENASLRRSRRHVGACTASVCVDPQASMNYSYLVLSIVHTREW